MTVARKEPREVKVHELRRPDENVEKDKDLSCKKIIESPIEAQIKTGKQGKKDINSKHNSHRERDEKVNVSYKCDVGTQVESSIGNEQDNGYQRKQGGKYFGPFKSLFSFTSHMNPFGNHSNYQDSKNTNIKSDCRQSIIIRSENRLNQNNNSKINSNAKEDIVSKLESNESIEENVTGRGNRNSSSSSHFPILTLAQKYLFRRNHAKNSKSPRNSIGSLSSQNITRIQSRYNGTGSLSEPVTPVKQISNCTHGASRTGQIISSQSSKIGPNSNHIGSSLLSQDQTQATKLSVRFIDQEPRSQDEVDENDVIAEEDEEDDEEDLDIGATDDEELANDKGSEFVARLFKFPSPLVANKLDSNRHQHQVDDSEKQQASSDEPSDGECPMDSSHFRHYGYRLIDYICNYLDTIRDRRVTPLNIEPGYLKSLIEPAAPERGEPFPRIMEDFEKHIMCGITHWQHPHFHAYFPAGNAYPSILADMLSDALGCVGFSWAASPAYTELETIMLDWMGKMIGLPDEFLCLPGSQESRGGGVIQGSASECVLVSLLAARHWAIEKLRLKYPGTPDVVLLGKLIGYCSKEAHSCVEKAAMIGFIRMRALDTDAENSLRGETLSKSIESDIAQGLEPFLVSATLGTTSCVSFDNLEELGLVCKKHDIWLHVDAAYAGSALICPEFKYLIKGIEMASSFNMNPNKWMLINFDCSLMWVKDRFRLTRAFVVDPLYLQHSYSDQAIDYRHWGIPLSRRFRSLKLWFVIRNYGIQGLQEYIRKHVRLAKQFEQLIRSDSRFSVTNQVVLGLVCFRLIGSNALNQRLLSMINASGKLHMVPASLNGRFVIRFCICDRDAKEEDILYAFKCIQEFASELIASIKAGKERIRAISQQNTVEMIASALPLGVQSPDIDGSSEVNTISLTTENQRRSISVDSQRDQRSVSALDGRSDSTVISIEESRDPFVSSYDNGQPRDNSETQVRPSSRLGVKSPLTKQRSMQAGEPDGYESEINRTENNLTDFLKGDVINNYFDGENHQKSDETNEYEVKNNYQREQQDELFRLTQKRNRTSGRYKRKFFVRVVSDPRVYRASISGDINAHSSSGSFGTNSISTPNQSISSGSNQQNSQQQL